MNADMPCEACVELTIRGETLLLYPDRAVFWRSRRTLIVADTHFGKGALFRLHGLAVPDGTDQSDRHRLDRLLAATSAQRLVVLGDFLHAPLDGRSQSIIDLAQWSAEAKHMRIHVVAGNHDRGAPRASMPHIRWHDDELGEAPFRFVHDYDRAGDTPHGLFTLSGHLHPVARLWGPGKRSARVPIFWHRADGLVLPSFGAFTGGYVVKPDPHDQIYAAGPDRVIRFR